MYRLPTTDPYLAADLVGFSVGIVICTLLLILTLRAAAFPGTPRANILLAVCGLVWNVGGLGHAMALTFALAADAGIPRVTAAVQFSAAACWPIPMLVIWRPLAVVRWRRVCSHILLCVAYLDAAAIVLTIWSAALVHDAYLSFLTAKEITSYNAAVLLAFGAIVLLRGPLTSKAIWFSTFAVLSGLFGTAAVVLIHYTFTLSRALDATFLVVSQQLTLMSVLGAFFLFARFRFADLFISMSLRILLTSATAVMVLLVAHIGFVAASARPTAPWPAHFLVESLLVTLSLAVFARLDRSLVTVVNRWIVRAPDYRHASRQLAEALDRSRSEADIIAAVVDAVCDTLEVSDARMIPLSSLLSHLWPAEICDGAFVELTDGHPLCRILSLPDLELLVPVWTSGGVSAALAIAPGRLRRGLVTHEVNYLRTLADQLGSRLDMFRHDQETNERHNRETLLRQQVAEAELRALRAQINPHFLFNALNTIAELIITTPSRAEAVTLRLASVFRYVLARSTQPVTSVRDEMDFVRSYLQIEGARFGERLQVEIDVPRELQWDHIPSLILQPVVENALKHGLGPKPDGGHVWISAYVLGTDLCLKVEDDGVGLRIQEGAGTEGRRVPRPASFGQPTSPGVGLTNVAQRLATLYQSDGRISIEARRTGGTSVTIHIPRGKRATAA